MNYGWRIVTHPNRPPKVCLSNKQPWVAPGQVQFNTVGWLLTPFGMPGNYQLAATLEATIASVPALTPVGCQWSVAAPGLPASLPNFQPQPVFAFFFGLPEVITLNLFNGPIQIATIFIDAQTGEVD